MGIVVNDWVEDGHKVHVVWDADSLSVQQVDCPFEGSSAFCNRKRNYCVVQRFIGVFGAEVNVGRTVVNGPIEIAWIGMNGDSDIDDELSGIWITPINDPDYIIFKRAEELNL